MKYESYYSTIIINGEEQRTLCYKNPEYLRDYCGSFYNNIIYDSDSEWIENSPEAYMYFLPNAIDALVRVYHFYGIQYPSNIAKINIYNRVLIDIRDFNLFSEDTDVYMVYKAIFENGSDLSMLLRKAAESIMDSDQYRAKFYVKNCVEDDTMRKILDKSLNGHKVDKIKIDKEIFNLIDISAT